MKFSGIVKKRNGRGKSLGFPTANIDAPDQIEDGLYLAWTVIKPDMAQRYPSLAFVGSNKMFDETDRRAEIYILDFDSDIYDKEIEVEIIQKLRPIVKFHSTKTLIQQMQNDEREARRIFKKLL
jgi:riboflavin kinase/FMN adenylyltransferase